MAGMYEIKQYDVKPDKLKAAAAMAAHLGDAPISEVRCRRQTGVVIGFLVPDEDGNLVEVSSSDAVGHLIANNTRDKMDYLLDLYWSEVNTREDAPDQGGGMYRCRVAVEVKRRGL